MRTSASRTLRSRAARRENFGHHASWEDDGAYKPLNMMRLTDSWIRRVDFKGVSEALSIVSSANCSAYDIEISGNRGHSGCALAVLVAHLHRQGL